MDTEKDKMAERILHLTLEILFQLTGEDYIVVKTTSSERYQAPVSEGWGRPLSPITRPPPHLLIHENINDQKILELTYKMIELLTGEVPIRCQDVTVYFSMEEWEYLEGHKDLYKDVMMEVPQPRTSPVLSSKRITPERCPRPLLPQDCKQENPSVPQDYQAKVLTHINTTETYVQGYELCEEEISKQIYRTDDCTRNFEGYMIFSDFAADYPSSTSHTYEEHVIFADTPQVHLRKNLSSDRFQQILSSASSMTNMQNKRQINAVENEMPFIRKNAYLCSECGKYCSNKSSLVTHQRSHTGEKPFSCSECGKRYSHKAKLVVHERIHTGEKPFACSECGKCYSVKDELVIHQRSHTGEQPFSCSECGKCFNWKKNLVAHLRIHTGDRPFSCSECGKLYDGKAKLEIHQRIHTGEKPFSCSTCGKSFKQQSVLRVHEKIHTSEKPFPCSECGKSFTNKSDLVTHRRRHTGEKPFSCSECGKCFTRNSSLVSHQKIHTGEKPFSCSECGKGFNRNSNLVTHQRIHTGKKPFSCSECGKGFYRNSCLVIHKRTHTGEKPFSCSECGKVFNRKTNLVKHQRTHKGQ
ncbi:uncharacterized protein LOC143767259 isoform X2 [Ranitomeya variabilis]